MTQATTEIPEIGDIPAATIRRAMEALAREERRRQPVTPEQARVLLAFYARELARDREEARAVSIVEAQEERDEYASLRAAALGIERGHVWVPES